MTTTSGARRPSVKLLGFLMVGVIALIAALFAEAGYGLTPTHAATTAGGGTLTLGEVGAPTTMDPRKLDNGSDVFPEWAYDSLDILDANGKYVPDLATSWGYVGTGNTEFQFHIRSGVKFSDGTTMTAQDVVNTIDAEMNSGTTCASEIDTLTSATASGNVVDLKFSAAVAEAQSLFDQSAMCGEVVGPQATGTVTDGTGPYELDSSATVTDSSYVFVQNPNYWNKSLKRFQKVVLDVYQTPQAEVNAALSGQIQVMSTNDSTQVPAAQRAGLNIYSVPSGVQALFLTDFDGTLVPALKNLKVRQAISYAIDRKAMTRALYGKYAQPNDEMVLPGFLGYVPSMANYYAYNPAKAKKLLKEAGYPHGFSMTMIASSGVGYENTTQAVASYLGKVGIKVTLKQDPTHNEAVIDLFNRQYPSFVWGNGGQDLPVQAPELYGTNALFNPFHNSMAHMVDLVNQGNSVSGAQATKLYEQAETYQLQQAWDLSLLDDDAVLFAKPGVVGNFQFGSKYPNAGSVDEAFWSPGKSA